MNAAGRPISCTASAQIAVRVKFGHSVITLADRIMATANPMNLRRLPLFALFAAVALSGCVTDNSDAPQLYVGMSRDHLRSHFGEPLRIEPAAAGGEDWYYSFLTWATPQVESSSSYDPVGGRSDSVSVSLSDSKSTQEYPVHLSADGFVMGPLPPGRIVGR